MMHLGGFTGVAVSGAGDFSTLSNELVSNSTFPLKSGSRCNHLALKRVIGPGI